MNFYQALVTSKGDIDALIEEVGPYLRALEEVSERYADDPSYDNEADFKGFKQELGDLLSSELSQVLDDLEQQITRPEEARKFTIMRNKVNNMMRWWDRYNKVGPKTNPYYYQKQTIDTLNYLKRYWHRLERYKAIPKEIKHGPFTLINEYGYTEGEYDDVLELFDEAAQRIDKKGFRELLYGDVVLTTQKAMGSNAVGQYDPFEDYIDLAVDWKGTGGAVAVLCHEFGHRLWRKLLTSEEQEQYTYDFGWICKKDLEELWEALEANNFSLRLVKKGLTEVLRFELDYRWKSVLSYLKRYMHLTTKEVREALARENSHERSIAKRHFTHLKTTGEVCVKPKMLVETTSVSRYGLTNPEEDFCEAFTWYCMGWKLNPISEQRLLQVL